MEVETLTPMQNFYCGKQILITGVTGFLGKMILEKLLRCCPGVGEIYLLMREKRGKTPEKRLEEILNLDLFKKIRKEIPEFKKKIKVIYGDIEKEDLGINPENIKMLTENVDIVLHAAARVRWDDPLKIAAICHIVATKYLIKLLKEFKKLQVFVYVSTSYVHRDPDLSVPEYIVKKEMTPDQLMDALSWMDDEAVEAMSSVLLKTSNTYLLTKALTENVVENERGNIPTAIVRPCAISPSYKDPFPGWCDTVQGIQGLFLAAAKGFLRTLYCDRDLRINLIPADVVVNAILTAGWHTVAYKQEHILVLNCVIEYEKLPLATSDLLDVCISKRGKYPLVNMYRYPDFTIHHSMALYHIHAFFDHTIPAILGDIFIFIFTGKTLMYRLYKKINFLVGVYFKIGRTPWICKQANYHLVKSHQSEDDANMFFMNADDLVWEKYIDEMLIAGRKTLAKEDPSNIPYAKKKAQVWWFVTTLLKWMVILYFVYYLCSKIWSTSVQFVPLETRPFKLQS